LHGAVSRKAITTESHIPFTKDVRGRMKMIPKVGEEFHPDISMKSLYYIYLALGVAVFCLSWMIPVIVVAFLFLSLSRALVITAVLFSPVLVAVLFTAFWISKYYSSIRYSFTNNEVVVERGVYWKRKSFVPYNRITNIEIVQGPIARRFELGTIRIQTAGFSAGGGGTTTHIAEAVLLNVKNFEELKDTIMNFVRRLKPVAVEAEAEVAAPEDISKQILNELRKIREILEES